MSEEDKQRYTQELESALKEGIKVLENGGNCVDCVEAVVKYLEDVPIFNAGYIHHPLHHHYVIIASSYIIITQAHRK